ncbi:MAG: glyoxalase/bleomycin resistance/extradiol dioxygenase family protein, partial [Novosphingobium sp.]
RTSDVVATSRFFAEVLDMDVRDTPGIPDRSLAAWIHDDGGRAAIHLTSADVHYPWETEAAVAPAGSGRVHHVALRCVGHAAVVDKLDRLGIAYRPNLVAEIGLRQLFVTEMNGILFELNFFGD